MFAGIFAAILKVTVFKKNRPLVIHAFVIVLVTEVVHMCLVPLTHLNDIENATMVIYNTFLYLVFANIVVVLFVFMATSFMNYKFKGVTFKEMLFNRDIFFDSDLFQSFRFWLLVILFVAFAFVFLLIAGSHEMNSAITTQQKFSVELDSLQRSILTDSARYNKSVAEMGSEYCADWSSDENVTYELADKNNNVISQHANAVNFAATTQDRPEDLLYRIKIDNDSYYIMYTYVDDYKLCLAVTEKYQLYIPHLITIASTFIMVFIFGLLMFAVFKLLRKMMDENFGKLNKSLDKLASGEFDEKVDENMVTQFSELSHKINTTVGTLKDEIEKEATKYNSEFEMAHEIQVSSLPSVFPAFPDHPEIDVYAKYRSAREVGGDFYDYFYVGKNKICFVIADVSGKGIPAAMYMMRAKSAIMMFARNTQDPAKTLTETNNYLCDNNIADMFVTAWVGILDTETGHLDYASAGHNPPSVISSKEGTSHQLESTTSLVLGGLPNVEYKNNNGDFSDGQILVLYTDGVTEANDPKGNLYGEARLLTLLKDLSKDSLQDICEKVIADVDIFANGTEQFDDITVLALKYIMK